MKKLISELREFIKTQYINDRVLSRLEPIVKKMEAKATKEPKPKKSAKLVELTDNGICYILKRKDISSISFRIEPYEKVTICTRSGRAENYKVSENREVLENLIADFKG